MNHFEFDVTWRTSQLFLKLHFIIQYYGVFAAFLWFPSFRIWVQGSERKPGNHGKSLFYSFFFSNFIKFAFVFVFLIFIHRTYNSPVQLLFPWFPWFPQFPSFRPGRSILDHKNEQVLNFYIVTSQISTCKAPNRFQEPYT